MSERTNDYWVTVCAHCWHASCWHGELFCDQHADAGTLDVLASQLDDLTDEHPSYYSREKISKVCGG